MKKLYFLLFTLLGVFVAQSQTIYSENMGTSASGNPAANTYSGWSNTNPIIYTGTATMRTSTPSSYVGASASVNAFFAAAGGQVFEVSGINTSSYLQANIDLSFGYLTTTTTAQMVIETSTDGSTYTPITFTNNTTTSWTLVTIPSNQIPSTTNLRLRFTAPTTGGGMRIDDIKLTNVSATCPLTLGTFVKACVASTSSLDSYTVTIPYTGGGTGTYTITGGTVSGDNPNSVAAGNMIVTVTEGTDFAINISGATCNFDLNGLSPECKPINTLPYFEPFNYTVGQSLGSQQMWTNVNSGDEVVVKAGNLTYGTTTGTGNSVEFSGAGIDPFTPFTATTSGTVYTGFMMKVSDLTNVTTDGNQDYFAALTDASKGFQARLFVKKTGTQYQLGFDSAGTTTTNYDATLRNVGDVVYVILGYDFATNTLNAWLNPNLATFNAATPASLTNTPATAIAEIAGFMIRQGNATNLPTIEMDELKISTVTTFLGSSSFDAISGFKMYPNPSNGNTLYFTTVANAELDVQVYDMLGKQVLNSKVSNNTLNISKLTQGIYIVKVTEEGKTATRKLVVQ